MFNVSTTNLIASRESTPSDDNDNNNRNSSISIIVVVTPIIDRVDDWFDHDEIFFEQIE